MLEADRGQDGSGYFYFLSLLSVKRTFFLLPPNSHWSSLFRKVQVTLALACVVQLVERLAVHQKVAGSVPGQGMYADCEFNPRAECVQEATDRCFSPPPFLSF